MTLSKSWIFGLGAFAGVAIAMTANSGVFRTASSEPGDNYQQLLAKERANAVANGEDLFREKQIQDEQSRKETVLKQQEAKIRQLETEKIQLRKISEAALADAKKAPDSQEIEMKLAIPEMPEMTWEMVRAFNLPLNNPAVVPAFEALFLAPDDTVCGVLVDGQARAYPWFVMANYHCVNDLIGDVPIVVNLCEACNGGSAFLANVAGTTLDFRGRGLKNGTWYAADYQTGSLWLPFAGTAFEGPLKGTKLERVRMYYSTWRQWVRDHPDTTVVVTSDELLSRPHGRDSHMADDQVFSPMVLKRLIGSRANPARTLLPQAELVFGFVPKTSKDEGLVYRISELEASGALVHTRFENSPILLFVRNEHQVGAYIRQIDGKKLELEQVSAEPFVMKDQLGNLWDAWGSTQSGPNHPAEMEVANGYFTKWYEWAENFPNTKIAEVKEEVE